MPHDNTSFHSDSIALTAILDADGILSTPDITDRFGFAISDPIKNSNSQDETKTKPRIVPLRNEAKISINLKSDGKQSMTFFQYTFHHIFICTLYYTLSYTPSNTTLIHTSRFPPTHPPGKEYTAEDVELLQRVDNELARMAATTMP